MSIGYTAEKNTLILISLLKQHGIKRIIASPGSTNISFVASVQQDDYFTVYSTVDERSAAYMACGLAVETGEPVVLSCTGATASRNYIPGLTEAFYRKIPVVAITSTQPVYRVGHHMQQVIDRSVLLNDIVKMSVQIPFVHENDDEEEWACIAKINDALLELKHKGGGPVHINLTTNYSNDFSIHNLPKVRKISRYTYNNTLPDIPNGKIGILVGAHNKWTDELVSEVDTFCAHYNAVVLCDHNSNYCGAYRVMANLICNQDYYVSSCRHLALIIHIGEVSASWLGMLPKEVWRVSPDGVVRDTFKKLTNVFEMNEIDFFSYYVRKTNKNKENNTYYAEWTNERKRIEQRIPELPFSNAWIAQTTSKKLPKKAVLHLGILNSLRVWNFFETDPSILCYSNTGGFGIDGCVSTLIGASLADKKTLYFGVVGDLAFFYDLNSIGNRHISSNVRIMLINNGLGAEFTNYNNRSFVLGDDRIKYIAAAGHFGHKSDSLVKDYALNLGFEYLFADSKESFQKCIDIFTDSKLSEKPILFEVFTDYDKDSKAIQMIQQIEQSSTYATKEKIKGLLGDKGVRVVKSMLKKE